MQQDGRDPCMWKSSCIYELYFYGYQYIRSKDVLHYTIPHHSVLYYTISYVVVAVMCVCSFRCWIGVNMQTKHECNMCIHLVYILYIKSEIAHGIKYSVIIHRDTKFTYGLDIKNTPIYPDCQYTYHEFGISCIQQYLGY